MDCLGYMVLDLVSVVYIQLKQPFYKEAALKKF